MKKLYFLVALFISATTFAQTWESSASLPSSASIRHHPVTFSIAGTGYLVGGANPSSNSLGDFYSYDPDADTWTTLANFPGQARGFSYGVSNETKGYMGFGLTLTSTEDFARNDLWEFDAETGNWTELTACPCAARWHPALVLVGDKIYMGLGANNFGDLGDFWEYDIPTDSWTPRPGFPGGIRHHPYFFELDGDVFVGFGHHASSIYNDFYRFNTATNVWTTLNDFPGQGRVAGTQFSYEGKGYILSGQGETHTNLPTGEFWEYDPADDSWTSLLAHPGGARWAPGSFVINNDLYFVAGQANSGERRDMMVYGLGGSVGIEEDIVANKALISPNPSQGEIFIQSEIEYSAANLYDASGRIILRTPVINQSVDFSSIVPGIYFLELTEGNKSMTQKLIIE